jgi:hypothetical protein
MLGVLTKPDRLPEGSRHEKLMEVFDHKRFALGHGYFVVKSLGQDQINKGFTHQQARLQEQQFFTETVPWATTFKHYESRFGTLNLQRFLSGKLAEQITKRLPIIDQGINDRLRQVETDLLPHITPPGSSTIFSPSSHRLFEESLKLSFPARTGATVGKHSSEPFLTHS